MDEFYKDQIVWFNGDRVKLSGDIKIFHGGEFCMGTWIEGHKKGNVGTFGKEYVDTQLKPAVPNYAMVQGPGAMQYTFTDPPKDTQLGLL